MEKIYCKCDDCKYQKYKSCRGVHSDFFEGYYYTGICKHPKNKIKKIFEKRSFGDLIFTSEMTYGKIKKEGCILFEESGYRIKEDGNGRGYFVDKKNGNILFFKSTSPFFRITLITILIVILSFYYSCPH
jgi:hypothetical protein